MKARALGLAAAVAVGPAIGQEAGGAAGDAEAGREALRAYVLEIWTVERDAPAETARPEEPNEATRKALEWVAMLVEAEKAEASGSGSGDSGQDGEKPEEAWGGDDPGQTGREVEEGNAQPTENWGFGGAAEHGTEESGAEPGQAVTE